MQNITGELPRLVFRMVGDHEFHRRAESILCEANVNHDWQRRDPSPDAFRASVREEWPFLNEADLELIDRHFNVLHFGSEPYAPAQAAAACQHMLVLVARLLESDGWALKCESSGVSHARETWLKLASRAERCYRRLTSAIGTPRERLQDRRNFWTVLYQTLVDGPLQVHSVFHSRGMHLLGQPELVIKKGDLTPRVENAGTAEAAQLFHSFAVYLLAEGAPVRFQDGQCFALAGDTLPFQATWEACTEHDCGGMRNPFGRWRFTRIRRPGRVQLEIGPAKNNAARQTLN